MKKCEIEIGDKKSTLDDGAYILCSTAVKKNSRGRTNTKPSNSGKELQIESFDDTFKNKRILEKFVLICKSADSTFLTMIGNYNLTLNSIPVVPYKCYPLDNNYTIKVQNMKCKISIECGDDVRDLFSKASNSPKLFTQNDIFNRQTQEIDDDTRNVYDAQTQIISSTVPDSLNDEREAYISFDDFTEDVNDISCSQNLLSEYAKVNVREHVNLTTKKQNDKHGSNKENMKTSNCQVIDIDDDDSTDVDEEQFKIPIIPSPKKASNKSKEMEKTSNYIYNSCSEEIMNILENKRDFNLSSGNVNGRRIEIDPFEISTQIINLPKSKDDNEDSDGSAETQIFDTQLINFVPRTVKTFNEQNVTKKSTSNKIDEEFEIPYMSSNNYSLSNADTQIFDSGFINFFDRPKGSREKFPQVILHRAKNIVLDEQLLKKIHEPLDLDVIKEDNILTSPKSYKDQDKNENNYFSCTQELVDVLMSQKPDENIKSEYSTKIPSRLNDSSFMTPPSRGILSLELPSSQEIKSYLSKQPHVSIPDTESEAETASDISNDDSEESQIVFKRIIPIKKGKIEKIDCKNIIKDLKIKIKRLSNEEINKYKKKGISVSAEETLSKSLKTKKRPSNVLDKRVPEKRVKKDESITNKSCNMSTRTSSRNQTSKYKVMITQIENNDVIKAVEKLNGRVVNSNGDILVSNKIRRTFKLLMAISNRIPIVHTDWIFDSLQKQQFLDPYKFLLVDAETEALHNFKLKDSLEAKEKLLSGYTIYTTPNVLPPPAEIKQLIESNGGVCIFATKKTQLEPTRNTKTLTIGCKKDVDVLKLLPKPYYEADMLVSGILTQKLVFNLKKWYINCV